MKPRARRVTLTAAVLGIAVIAVLVVAHWGTARDHVEGWYFLLTRENLLTIVSDSKRSELPIEPSIVEGVVNQYTEGDFLRGLADYSGCPVILDPLEHRAAGGPGLTAASIRGLMNRGTVLSGNKPLATNRAKELLLSYGSRVLELRFPRRAYLVRRDEAAAQ